jgi:prepilin-type N-terminal cleavage/methylation domain-containing protein
MKMKKMRGFTLIELLIVVAIIAILAAIAVPNFLEAQVRAKVSRVRSDQRSLATAIEAYYVDHNIYPAFAVGAGGGYNGGMPSYNYWVVTNQGNSGGAADLPCFSLNSQSASNASFMTLTTPMSYITTYPADPFATNKGCTFSYASVFPGDQALTAIGAGGRGGVGWILWSFGPDVDEYKSDGPSDSPFGVYEPAIAQPSELLLVGGNPAYTYDPTNGTVSEGDVWRVKQ